MRGFLACLGAVLAARAPRRPAVATSASGIAYGLTDDAWLANGPGTIDVPCRDARWARRAGRRFTMRWDQIAPTEPAFADRPAGPGLRLERRRRRARRLARATGSTSSSNSTAHHRGRTAASRRTTCRPRARAVRRIRDCGRARYPWVTQLADLERAEPGALAEPDHPRRLHVTALNPAYAAIHAATTGAKVAGGGTAPRGSTGGVSPVAWITGMHTAGARLDAYAHNPYPLDPKRETPLTRLRARPARRSRWQRSAGSNGSSRATSRARASG